MLHQAVLLAALLIATGSTTLSETPPVVHVSAGTIQGERCPDSGAKVFQSIPYAQPPIGHLRFRPPKPFNGSYAGGILYALQSPPGCIQWPSAHDVQTPTSEDCLYLDIYVPANATANSSLPVKVWAHGGDNDGGALNLPIYNACNLATDAIIVAFNYRLGPLGFLFLPDAGILGNMAIQDYLAALTWVKENIGAFGGDATKVLLFGQGAGADNTFVVSTLPQAKGLISAAIMQSGGGVDLAPFRTARYAGQSFAKALGCDIKAPVCLQVKPLKQLLDAYIKTHALLDHKVNGGILRSPLGINLPNTTKINSPVLDGQFIKHEPLKVGSQVPIIIGQNEDDSTLAVVPYYIPDVEAKPLTEKTYQSFLSQWGRFGEAINLMYPLSAFNHTKSTSSAALAAISRIVTISGYNCPAYKTLRAAISAGTPAYTYRFNNAFFCPWLGGADTPFPSWYRRKLLGATHTTELPFVFGNMDKQAWGNGSCNATQGDRELSKSMIASWTGMAVRGNPSTKDVKWPRFETCSNTGVYIQDSTIATSELDFDECEFWDGLWAQMGGVKLSWPNKACCSPNPPPPPQC